MWKLPNIEILPGESFAKVHFIDAVQKGAQSQEKVEIFLTRQLLFTARTQTHTYTLVQSTGLSASAVSVLFFICCMDTKGGS